MIRAPTDASSKESFTVSAAHASGRRAAPLLAIVPVLLIALGGLVWLLRVTVFAAAPDAVTAMATGRYADAVAFYDVAATTGDPVALNALGNLHYLGLGTARNPRRAAELYYESAKSGYAAAQMNLGNLYSQGLGVANDAMRAFGWYRMADIHGSPAAEYYLYQISVEYTLSPLQQSTAAERWRTLDHLLAETL